MSDTKIEQIIEWLLLGEVEFSVIAAVYIKILEQKNKDDRELIAELASLILMYKNPKMNGGTKEQLESRFKKAIIKSGVYKDTVFEKSL